MPDELQVLGRAVKQAQYRQHRALDSRLAAAGTTLAQWDALRAISRAPGAPARALATATFQSEQAFGTLAGRLTALGLIDRRPGHGRRIEHYLTPSGEVVLSAGHRIADEVLAACYSHLSPADRATLLDLLQRVDDGADASADR
ncbi:MarR family winged helix-turn-helix transcriptional regulator [Streptomyces lavendulae]|uniref:MarR family winged helix-turn-helix transcriptional regulator n=1 Tax=Streptomyces lavendulae TaxID=1914 RepID=UPI003674F377